MLEIKVEQVSKTKKRLFLKGYLDITTASTLTQFVEELSSLKGVTLLINFSETSFIDSTGIGAILNVIFLSREQEFTVLLEDINEDLKEILETVGVFRVLEAVQKG
ncbi:STAS domain-containing protein [Halalkalibacterium ligniniphilum]|uniref:STAS domain-containing protein n=1 Tax=Halalkalibacterium ligniniphilum TaxID=1134413 RepID=UPI000344A781|nr:STAS domain-containing protein [Halalkalibacterium ligniniphilum]